MTATEFLQYLEQGGLWTLHDYGVHTRASKDGAQQIVTNETLATIHPALPGYLADFGKNYAQIRLDWTGTKYLQALITQLTEPRPLQLVDGETAYAFHLTNAYRDTTTNRAVICGVSYTLLNPAEPWPASRCWADLYANADWMDQQYPGWDDRAAVGRALGYTGQALSEYVLHRPKKDASLARLPDVLSPEASLD